MLSDSEEEHPRKSRRLTHRHGPSTVNYDMKHHPIDDVLRPKYSAGRRGRRKQDPGEINDSDPETGEENEIEAYSKNMTPPHLHHRRSSRNVDQSKKPNYSAKWHPLDQMLEDNASSTVVVKGDPSKNTHTSGSSSPLKDEEDSTTISSDLDHNPGANKASEMEVRIPPVSPSQRRSTRVASSKNGPQNYDMKYDGLIYISLMLRLTASSRFHMMDSILRPNATAKRIQSRVLSHASGKTSLKLSSTYRTLTEQSTDSSPKSLTRRPAHHKSSSSSDEVNVPGVPAWSLLQNPYSNRVSLTWAEIQEMDRRVFLLQKGAPLDSSTLPLAWSDDIFKKILLDEGVNTLDELSPAKNLGVLKSRYESVKLGLQKFFKSELEPANNICWTISKAEGFDVYEMKSGSRYWRHQKDSVVEGTTISSRSSNMRSTSETARHTIQDRSREATNGIRRRRDKNKAIALKSMQTVMDEGGKPDKSRPKLPPVLGVDTDRTTNFDREDDSERGTITETEETLIESMRGEHVASLTMSDAALEELLLPVQQYLGEDSKHEVTSGLALRGSEAAGESHTHPDKTHDNVSFVAPKAKAMGPNTFSNRGPEAIQLKEEMTSGEVFGFHENSDEPLSPEMQVKTKKRKSRAELAVIVHEDLPGRTRWLRRSSV